MRNFTKGCLITALVLFIFGAAFWGICGIMGGFAQLEERGIRKRGDFSIGWNGIRLSSLPGVWNWIWDDGEAADGDDMSMETPYLVEGREPVQTPYRASDITGIDIELGGSNLVIRESEDEFIWLENGSAAKTVKYGLKNGTFQLYYGRTIHFWNNVSRNGTIYLYLPENLSRLNEVDIEMGAGNLECNAALEAAEIDIEAGAGHFTMEELRGDSVTVKAGAGTVEINKMTATELSMESSAGGIVVGNLDAAELNLETGAGSIEIAGSVTNVNAECAAGSIGMTLRGAPADYNYELECDMGSIRIGDNEYSGLATEKSVNNRAGKWMDIQCSVGSVDISFE